MPAPLHETGYLHSLHELEHRRPLHREEREARDRFAHRAAERFARQQERMSR